MIPRTDQFRENSDGSVALMDTVSRQDYLQHLLERIDTFLALAAALPRSTSGDYLAKDPRAGRLPSLKAEWMRVITAAQMVLSSTLTVHDVVGTGSEVVTGYCRPRKRDVMLADVARQVVFLAADQDLANGVRAETVERLRALRTLVEHHTAPRDLDAMRAIQRELHRWVRDMPGVRDWLTHEIVPRLVAMWEEQRSLRRQQELVDAPVRERWREARDSGTPFEERLPVVYDRELDPRNMSTATIGRLRDEGRFNEADLAEAYFVVMLHDAGEAGNLDKLCPLLGPIEGFERSYDWAYLDRADTGLERDDTPPRFSPDAFEGMVGRLRKRFEAGPRAEQITGFTLKAIREAMGLKSHSSMQAIFKDAGLKQPESGDGHQKFGATTIRALIAFCRYHSDARRRRYVPVLEELLRGDTVA